MTFLLVAIYQHHPVPKIYLCWSRSTPIHAEFDRQQYLTIHFQQYVNVGMTRLKCHKAPMEIPKCNWSCWHICNICQCNLFTNMYNIYRNLSSDKCVSGLSAFISAARIGLGLNSGNPVVVLIIRIKSFQWRYLWFKCNFSKYFSMCYASQVWSEQGSNLWPPDHEQYYSCLWGAVILTTRPSGTSLPEHLKCFVLQQQATAAIIIPKTMLYLNMGAGEPYTESKPQTNIMCLCNTVYNDLHPNSQVQHIVKFNNKQSRWIQNKQTRFVCKLLHSVVWIFCCCFYSPV